MCIQVLCNLLQHIFDTSIPSLTHSFIIGRTNILFQRAIFNTKIGSISVRARTVFRPHRRGERLKAKYFSFFAVVIDNNWFSNQPLAYLI